MSNEEPPSLRRQRGILGAKTRMKGVPFVPAAVAPQQALQLAPQTTPSISPGDRYLNIVLTNGAPIEHQGLPSTEVPKHETGATRRPLIGKGIFCEVCNLRIDAWGDESTTSSSHESNIAHMVCLTHAHPPSHLDRSRQGFKYLSSFGWDPDSRQGLGATGEGIRAPIKAKVKNDTVGLGVSMKRYRKPPGTKIERMDARQARRKDTEETKRRERLQEMFYRNDDVEKHLGVG